MRILVGEMKQSFNLTLLIFKNERSNESVGNLNIGSEGKSKQLIQHIERESHRHRAHFVPAFKLFARVILISAVRCSIPHPAQIYPIHNRGGIKKIVGKTLKF